MNWMTMLAFWLAAASIIYLIIMWARKEAERINKSKGGKKDELHRALDKLNRSR